MSNKTPSKIFTWLKEIPMTERALIVISMIASVFAIVLINQYFTRFSCYFCGDKAEWGQFGDYVGGILNPLFSLTALFALLYTIRLQSKELRDSTEHLKESAKALGLQNEVMMRQQFENTFFQMLGLFNETVQGIELKFSRTKNSSENEKVRFCYMDVLVFNMKSSLQNTKNENIKIACDMFYQTVNIRGQYFRTLYSIIKFIDKSNLPDDDKKFYSNIVRAQLSDAELVLLFYNCLCLDDYERGKFLPLIEKYDLLEYLKAEELANPAHYDLLDFLKQRRAARNGAPTSGNVKD